MPVREDQQVGTGRERIRWITHQGEQILFVDFSCCTASEVEKVTRAVPDYVTVRPRGSVLVLPISMVHLSIAVRC
jgi:hypothetical protein